MRGESAHEEGPHADGRSRSECGVEEGGGMLDGGAACGASGVNVDRCVCDIYV